jgi:hypothetical protein
MNEEPVNIDILLRQNVDEEAEKATRGIENISEASEEAWKHSKEAIQLQQEVIARLKKELAGLEEEFKKVNIGTNDPKLLSEREKQSRAIHAVMEELKGEEDALKEMMSASDQAAQKAKSLETRMREVREELAAMAMAGKKDTAEYRAKEQQLGTLATAYREVYQTQLQLSKGGASLQGIVSGLSALSGLFSAGAGALGLFNTNSEAYNKIQTKMQSLMAITIGLQQVQQTLYQTSAFRIQTVTRAKQLWTTTTNRLTVALGISNVAAKALMGTLTLGLSVAIGAAIAVIDKLVSKHKEAREEANKFNESVAQNSAEQIANYENLRTSYNALGNDVKAKEKFILDNQNAFNQLGVSINSVNDADNLFIGQTEAFKNSILQRAKAAASMEMASEKYKEALTKYSEADKREQEPSKWEKATSSNDFYDRNGQNVLLNKKAVQAADKIREKGEELEKEAQNYVNQSIVFNNNASESLKNASIEAAGKIETGTKAWWEAQKKNAQARLDAMKESEIGSAEWEKNVQEINKADDALKKFDIKTVKTNDTNKDKDKDKEEKARANEKLKKLEVDIQQDIDAAVVAAMQEGKEKKLKELENEYNKRIDIITERRKELEEIEKKGIDVSKQKDQLDKLEEKEKDNYKAGIAAVETGANNAIAEVMNEINSRFKTQSQARLDDIDRFYTEQTKKAKENGATQAQLDEIELKHKQDTELEKQYIVLETLDFEEQIALKKAEIEDRNVLLQSQREEKLLQIQKENAEKRLQKLLDIKKNGGDVDKEIASTQVEIEGLTIKISKIPVDKLKEMAGYFKAMFQSLSAVGGEFGEAMSAIANSVDDITVSFDKEATTMDKVTAGVDGLVKLYSLAANQIEENKKKQAEWNDLITEAEHRASLARIELNAYQEANLFGVENPYSKAISGAKEYAAAMQELQGSLAKLGNGQIQTGTKKVVSASNVAGGAGAGAGVGAAIGSLIAPGIGTAIGAGIGALLGGIFGATQKKVVPVFESLTKQFGSILKDGTKTFELNPKILENYNKLDDSTKKLVDNWEEIRNKALEAQKQMQDTFKDLAGNIGDMLSQSLIDSFTNGDVYAAVDDFHKKVSDVIGNIIQQLIFSAYFQKFFDELQQRMTDSYGANGDQSIVDDILWFSNVYKEGIDAYTKDMKDAQDELKKQGFDLFQNDSTRTSTSKGIAQASQDSIDELNGRMTYLVMKVSDIGTISSEQLNTGTEQLAVMRAMLSQLDVMTENSEFLRHLSYIRDDISKVVRDGINLKS